MLPSAEAPSAERKNKTWLEVWGKAPTYSKFYQPCPYLESRGISPEVLEEFGVGFYQNPKSRSALNGNILFPIANPAGELLAFAWRNLETEGQRYCFPPIEKFDRTLELWNLHRALEEKDVIIVEGFFGCMNVHQHGHRCVVALMGSSLSEQQAELLTEHFRTVTFLIDPDEAGAKLARQAIEQLRGRTLLKLAFPLVQPDALSAEDLPQLLTLS